MGVVLDITRVGKPPLVVLATGSPQLPAHSRLFSEPASSTIGFKIESPTVERAPLSSRERLSRVIHRLYTFLVAESKLRVEIAYLIR